MPVVRALFLTVLIAAATPPSAWAQQQDTVVLPGRGPRVEPVAGLRVGFPQKLSGYVGFVLAERSYSTSSYTGWSITVEPGLGGGLVGIGRTTSGGYVMTSRVQAAVLRTWGDPWMVSPDRTYVGMDARFSMLLVGLTLGGYVRVPESGADPGVLFTAGIVVGL